ncbi:MAG: sugar isomerase, partial [Caproiciproducens sp.]|nr:sugar isomerase [Caproiciproducens sp.]
MKPCVREILDQLTQRYPALVACRDSIEKAYGLLEACYAGGGKVLICGNGGSAADAEHIVGELMKGFLLKRPLTGSEKEKLKVEFPEDGEYLATHL